MSKLKGRRGITLIELIITLGLIGVVTSLVFSFFFSNKKTLNNVEVKSDLQYEAKEVMNKISKYAMEATKAEFEAGKMTLVFTMVDDSEIVFTVKGEDPLGDGKSKESDGKVIITGKEIRFGNGRPSDSIICTNLKSLTLYGDKDKGINVDLELEKSGVSYSVADSFLFRNRELK